MPDFAVEIAEWSSSLTVDRLPPQVIAAAKANVFDVLACAIAGWSADGIASLAAMVEEWGGKSEASVWCTALKVPAHHAALVNGAMAHARDYEDTHDGAVLHAGVSVVPAAIAAAELDPQATGADLVAGVVVGLELICRLGTSTSIGIIDSGFLYTSLFGYFAATAAAARVLRLGSDTTANALGIVYSQAAGTHQVTRDAALTKRIQPGFAAKSAMLSIALARRGIDGARLPFEGRDGLFRSYLRGRYDQDRLREGLGSRFELLNLSYKPYPCCRFNHAAIDAALVVREQMGGNTCDIESVACGVNRQAYEAVCMPADTLSCSKSSVEAQFSLPFNVACALTHGGVGLRNFTERGLADSEVLLLAKKVHGFVDDDIEGGWARQVSPVDLSVKTARGVFRARVDVPRGHPLKPLTSEESDRKLADCLSVSELTWPVETADRIRLTVETLDRLQCAAAVVGPLTR